jgi:lipopolysaccharide/colanic/teichoic acid biosynthesis glycosyltransferase
MYVKFSFKKFIFKGYFMGKRLFDIAISLAVLIIFSPLFLLLAILIKKDSEGPVFYRQIRIGKDEKPFRIFKFRTMVNNAEKSGVTSTKSDDVRITRMGKFIRKYNLDELAQFINVLRGEMSIVGPRPEIPYFVDMFTEEEKKLILSVKPGITDWACIWNPDESKLLAGSDDPDRYYLEKIRPEKIRLQLKYVKEYSFWIDFKIMLMTLKVHLFVPIIEALRKKRDKG